MMIRLHNHILLLASNHIKKKSNKARGFSMYMYLLSSQPLDYVFHLDRDRSEEIHFQPLQKCKGDHAIQ